MDISPFEHVFINNKYMLKERNPSYPNIRLISSIRIRFLCVADIVLRMYKNHSTMCSEIWLQESELAVCGSSLKSLWLFQTGEKNTKRVPCKLYDQQLAEIGLHRARLYPGNSISQEALRSPELIKETAHKHKHKHTQAPKYRILS